MYYTDITWIADKETYELFNGDFLSSIPTIYQTIDFVNYPKIICIS